MPLRRLASLFGDFRIRSRIRANRRTRARFLKTIPKIVPDKVANNLQMEPSKMEYRPKFGITRRKAPFVWKMVRADRIVLEKIVVGESGGELRKKIATYEQHGKVFVKQPRPDRQKK